MKFGGVNTIYSVHCMQCVLHETS